MVLFELSYGLVSFLCGIVTTLLLQYYFFVKYLRRNPPGEPSRDPHLERFTLPDDIKKFLTTATSAQESPDRKDDVSLPINLLLQFLFHELRHRDQIKRWFYRKLSLEFNELLTKTTTGKLFETVKIRDLHLGSHFPQVNKMEIESVVMDDTNSYINVLNVRMDINYDGNFKLAIDAKMKFTKTAYLSVKVKHINGSIRLQFTRLPYTHWSLTFYQEPRIELEVESHFQGRQLQSNISTLIINQIKKAIRRKHTLPNYKIRYKPFFTKNEPNDEKNDEVENIEITGQLHVKLIEMTRLNVDPNNIDKIYAIVAVDNLPWVSIRKRQTPNATNYLLTLDVTLNRDAQQNIGALFRYDNPTKNATEKVSEVHVESVAINSPAHVADLRRGDRIVSIDGKPVQNVSQITKFLKGASGKNVRVERNVTAKYRFVAARVDDKIVCLDESSLNKSTETLDDLFEKDVDGGDVEADRLSCLKSPDYTNKLPKLLSKSNENVSKIAQTIGNFSLRKRKQSGSSSTDASSTGSLAVGSVSVGDCAKVPDSKMIAERKRKSVCESPLRRLIEHRKAQPTETPTKTETDTTSSRTRHKTHENKTICYETTPTCYASSMTFDNEAFVFYLRNDDHYLNVNVWARTKDERDVLLGCLNVNVSAVLSECRESILGHYINCFSFEPPDVNVVSACQSNPLAAHSGFEPCFCYGDVLLSFIWKPDEAVAREPVSLEIVADEHDDDLAQTVSQYEIIDNDSDHVDESKHDFVRTHFQRATQCGYCNKKIWLKDAVQCRTCAMSCHKKCIVKCQQDMPCKTCDMSLNDTDSMLSPTQITIVTNDEDSETLDESREPTPSDLHHRQSFCGLPTTGDYYGELKRVSSAHNLSVPGEGSVPRNQLRQPSQSLPTSPQRAMSQKKSLISINLLNECSLLLDDSSSETLDVPKRIDDDNTIASILRNLSECGNDEDMMNVAKETSKNLYADLEPGQRIDKINKMISKLKTTLDQQSGEHFDLTKKLGAGRTSDAVDDGGASQAELETLIEQADARVQALAVLMLHFCSGLQYAQDRNNSNS